MLIPVRTCSLYNQSPLPNWGLIAVTVVASLAWVGSGYALWGMDLVLGGEASALGLLGHMFLHGGIMHLAGNMLFLWVFGNSVCAKTGPLLYVPVYLLCGIGGGLLHVAVSGMPMVGASGAINGIVAFYLVLQPVNDVEMLFYVFYTGKRFTIAGFWVILYWLAWDLYGLLHSGGESHTAFTAHVGGFATGLLLGLLFVWFRWVKMDEYDNPTLPEYLGLLPKGHSSPSGPVQRPRTTRARSQRTPERVPSVPQRQAPPPTTKKYLEEESGTDAPVPPSRTTTFQCPHCQASLELDLGKLPSGGSLLCPACKGTIELVYE